MKYSRSLYPHWGPSPDPQFEDIRQYMISKAIVSGLSVVDRRVVAGNWYCFYTGKIYDISEHTPDLDHIIPLKAAHIRGGHSWGEDKRRWFANDPLNLVVVLAGSNRQKGALVSRWLPANIANGGDYLERITAVILLYKLTPTKNDIKTANFLRKKIDSWSRGIRLEPVKDWFKKTFNWSDSSE